MSASLTKMAWAVSHPRARRSERPRCIGSGWGMSTGATDGHGHASCPHCGTPGLDVTEFPHLLAAHAEVKR